MFRLGRKVRVSDACVYGAKDLTRSGDQSTIIVKCVERQRLVEVNDTRRQFIVIDKEHGKRR